MPNDAGVKTAVRTADRAVEAATAGPPWPVLIVDDDADVHEVTALVLEDFTFRDRPMELLSARSAAEAEAILAARPDIALALIDVVMETDDAGLRLVRHIREELGYRAIRIILRTGQPGQAPEPEVILQYDINDYKTKTELTARKLFTAVITSLRSFSDIVTIEEQTRRHMLDSERARREEARLLEVANAISSELHLDALLHKIIAATSDMLGAERSSLFLYDPVTHELWSRVAEGVTTREIRFPADAGLAGAAFNAGQVLIIPDAYADARFNPEVDRRTGFRTRNILCMPVRNKQGRKLGVVQVLNKSAGDFTEQDQQRLQAFCAQAAIALENAQLFEDVLNARNYNESILKSLSNGVVTLDADGTVIKANEAAARILGWGGSPPVGQPSEQVFSGDNAWIAEALAKVERTGEPELAVDRAILAGGVAVSSVNMTAEPMIDVKEQRIGSMLIFEDISREKRVKSTMSRYMSSALVEQLMDAGDAVLGGTTQEATVLFSDIRSFTTLAEKLGARGIVSTLNDYFTEMVEIVFSNNGILDKYIGDAMMAVFGTPFRGEEDADNALSVANEMMQALARFNRQQRASGGPVLRIGVGAATGEVVVGNIGSPRRMDYTVIGDSVNLSSRLESANKLYGTSVLIDDAMRRALKRPWKLRELDLIRVRGQDQAVPVYEALDHHDEESFARMDEVVAIFGEGLAAYRRRDWRAAGQAFEQALALTPDDGPSRLFRERCALYAATPPAEDWDGVWTMETK